MAWLYNGRTLKVGKSWTDDNGYKHPYNWATAWSDADKTHWGVTWQDDVDTSYDNRFYWAKDVERSLTDINVVDENGDAVIDPTTGVQMIQLGLKSQWIAQTKATANSLLAKSDWYVVRNAEKSVAIPSEITIYQSDLDNLSQAVAFVLSIHCDFKPNCII